jgi:hypothetical protein
MRRLLTAAAATVLAAAPAALARTPPPVMGGGAKMSPESDARVGALPSGFTPGTVQVLGLGDQHETLTAAQVAALPRAHVLVDHDGKTVNYSGPLVSDLLRDVDAPMGVRLHGSGVNDVVMVTAADKFRVVLSLAEVDPGFHKGAKVILADQADGKPLTGKEAPFRLMIDGDIRASRSEYGVVSIALKHLP